MDWSEPSTLTLKLRGLQVKFALHGLWELPEPKHFLGGPQLNLFSFLSRMYEATEGWYWYCSTALIHRRAPKTQVFHLFNVRSRGAADELSMFKQSWSEDFYRFCATLCTDMCKAFIGFLSDNTSLGGCAAAIRPRLMTYSDEDSSLVTATEPSILLICLKCVNYGQRGSVTL